jgi:hypothetical protein
MMKVISEAKGKYLILLFAVCQLLVTYCSKQIYPDASFHNVGSQAERNKLKEFMHAGTGKVINVRNAVLRYRQILNSVQYAVTNYNNFRIPH